MEKPLGEYGLQECHISNLQFCQGNIQFYASYAILLTSTSDGKRSSELFIPYQELLYFKVVKSQHVIHIALPNDYILQWVEANPCIVGTSGGATLQDLSSETGMEDCRYPMAMRFVNVSAMEHFIQYMVPHLKRDRESRSFSRMSISTLIPSRNSFSHSVAQRDITNTGRVQRVGNSSITSTEEDEDQLSQEDSFCTDNDNNSSISDNERSFSNGEESLTKGKAVEVSSYYTNEQTVQDVSVMRCASPPLISRSHPDTFRVEASLEGNEDGLTSEFHCTETTGRRASPLPCKSSEGKKKAYSNACIPFTPPVEQGGSLHAELQKEGNKTNANANKKSDDVAPAIMIDSEVTFGLRQPNRDVENPLLQLRCTSESVNIESQLEALQLPESSIRLLPRRREGVPEDRKVSHCHEKGKVGWPTAGLPCSPASSSTATIGSIASSHVNMSHKPGSTKWNKRRRSISLEGAERAAEGERKRNKKEVVKRRRGMRGKVHVVEAELSNPPAVPSHALIPEILSASPLPTIAPTTSPLKKGNVKIPAPAADAKQKVEILDKKKIGHTSSALQGTAHPITSSTPPCENPSFVPISRNPSRGRHKKEKVENAGHKLGTLPLGNSTNFDFCDVETLPHGRQNTDVGVAAPTILTTSPPSAPSSRNHFPKWEEQATRLNAFLLGLVGSTTSGMKKRAPRVQKPKKSINTPVERCPMPSTEMVPKTKKTPPVSVQTIPAATCSFSSSPSNHFPLPSTSVSEEKNREFPIQKLALTPLSKPGEKSMATAVTAELGDCLKICEVIPTAALGLSSIEEECAATPQVSESSMPCVQCAAAVLTPGFYPKVEGRRSAGIILDRSGIPSFSKSKSPGRNNAFSSVACNGRTHCCSKSRELSHIPAEFFPSAKAEDLKHQRLEKAMLSLNRISYYLQVMRETEEEVRGLLLVLGSE